MPHARRAIVLAAVQALTGLATTGSRVHPSRTWPVAAENTPCLLVYARTERSAPMTMKGAARRLARELTLAVEGVVAETDDSDATLDQVALEVETALAADPTLGGACMDLLLTSTDIEARADGEFRAGRIRLEFAVTYHTAANAPSVTI